MYNVKIHVQELVFFLFNKVHYFPQKKKMEVEIYENMTHEIRANWLK